MSTRLTSEARRSAILDAAVRLFSDKGFRGVTTRELAAAVGVSEPVLYQHFQTKGDLYKAILEERAMCGDRTIPSDLSLLSDPPGDDRSFLTKLANGIINWHATDPTYARLLLFSALEHHELSQLFFERYSEGFFIAVAGFFERRIRDGAFRRIDPSLAAQSFIGLAANYGMSRAVFKRTMVDLPQEQIVEGFVDIFLEGIRKRT